MFLLKNVDGNYVNSSEFQHKFELFKKFFSWD